MLHKPFVGMLTPYKPPSPEPNRSKVILLGRMGTPLDWSAWDAHCLERLGRKVKMGERIPGREWDKLGYWRKPIRVKGSETIFPDRS